MIRFNKPTIERKDLESVLYCMITDDLAPGDYMKEFRKQLCKVLDLNTVVIFNTYLQSLESAFRLIGAKPGDEIILSSFTRYRIFHAALEYGLKPVLVDMEEDSLLPSIRQIEERLNERTACILVQQLFGIPHDLGPYTAYRVPLVEDLDGALCSRINGAVIGSFGTMVTLNLNDDAVITTGNGGVLASNDGKLKNLYEEYELGGASLDYLMSDFNASLGISQLKKLEKSRERRIQIGKHYDDAVMASSCVLIGRDDGQELSYSSYPVLTRTPFEDCRRFFKGHGIPVQRGIDEPLHRRLGLSPAAYPRTEEMFNRLILLPIYPTLDGRMVEKIARGIRTIL
jgi:dTDP-4-amino-4,6-dideoxygalactose transaminase